MEKLVGRLRRSNMLAVARLESLQLDLMDFKEAGLHLPSVGVLLNHAKQEVQIMLDLVANFRSEND